MREDCVWAGGETSRFSFCVMADNPSPMTYTGTNTWVLANPDSGNCYIVDPGPQSESHMSAIENYLVKTGLTSQALLLTHMHHDHSEAAGELAHRLDVDVFSQEAGNFNDGIFKIGGGPELTVVSLPGHSSDSVGLCFPEDSSIVTGDILFLQSPTSIVDPGGSLKDYFDSLNRLRSLVKEKGYTKFLTAHGAPIDEPLSLIDKSEKHRMKRLDMVRRAILSGACESDQIFEIVYGGQVEEGLEEAARRNVAAQLDYLKKTNDPCMPQ